MTYPWTPQTTDDQDNALATLGQLKMVFSFITDTDTDTDGLPDWWEKEFFPKSAYLPLSPAAAGDEDQDGLTNAMEWAGGGNPLVFDRRTAGGRVLSPLVGSKGKGVSDYKHWSAGQIMASPGVQAHQALEEAELLGDTWVSSVPNAAFLIEIPTKAGLLYQPDTLFWLPLYRFATDQLEPKVPGFIGSGQTLRFQIVANPAISDTSNKLRVVPVSSLALQVEKNSAGQSGLNLLTQTYFDSRGALSTRQAFSWEPRLGTLNAPGAFGILPANYSGPVDDSSWRCNSRDWLQLTPLTHHSALPSGFQWPRNTPVPEWVSRIGSQANQGNPLSKWFPNPETATFTARIEVSQDAKSWLNVFSNSALKYRVSAPDLDQDGVPDYREFTAGTDPCFLDHNHDGVPDFLESADADADGLSDVLEIRYWGNLDQTATGDPDGDGLANLQELQMGFSPVSTHSGGPGQPGDLIASLEKSDGDTDGDGLTNEQDAVPWEKHLRLKRVPEANYIKIPLGVPGRVRGINNPGEVVIVRTPGFNQQSGAPGKIYVWKNGVVREMIFPPLPSGEYYFDPVTYVDLDHAGRLLVERSYSSSTGGQTTELILFPDVSAVDSNGMPLIGIATTSIQHQQFAVENIGISGTRRSFAGLRATNIQKRFHESI